MSNILDNKNQLIQGLVGVIILLVTALAISFQFHGETIVIDRAQAERSLHLSGDDAAAPKLGLFQLGAQVQDFDALEDRFQDFYLDADGDSVNFGWSEIDHDYYGDEVIRFKSSSHASPTFPDTKTLMATYFDKSKRLLAVKYMIRPESQMQCETIKDTIIESVQSKYDVAAFEASFANFDESRKGYHRTSVDISDDVIIEINDDCDHSGAPDFFISLFKKSEHHRLMESKSVKEQAASFVDAAQ